MFINVLILAEITSHIRNWYNAKLLSSDFAITHRYICYVMLRPEELLPNLLKKWKLSSVKLITKRTHMCGMSLNRQQSLKVVIVGQNSANS